MTTGASTARRSRLRRWAGYLLAGLLLAPGAFFVVNARGDLPLDVLRARWAPPPSRFVAVDGVEAHVRDEGQGPAVVLIHGTSSSLHTWDGWAAELASRHRVIRFDLPAFGLTGPSPSRDYSIDAYVAFVADLLQRMDVRRFVIAGNSLGGDIAWQYALAHPERVRGLVLVDAAGYPLWSAGVPLAFRVARWPVLPWLLTRLDPRSLVEDGVRRVYGDPSRIRAGIVDRYYQLALRPGNRRAFLDRMRSPLIDRSARLSELRVPTLVMWGARDHVIPVEAASRFARDIPGARLVVYDDLGHVPMEEDPRRTLDDVQRFLASLPAE